MGIKDQCADCRFYKIDRAKNDRQGLHCYLFSVPPKAVCFQQITLNGVQIYDSETLDEVKNFGKCNNCEG